MITILRKTVRANLLHQQNLLFTQRLLYSATATAAAPTQKDYYKILGIQKNANDAQIKEAYLSKAKQYHPDNQQYADVDKFREVVEAYQILSVRENRLNYDLSKDQYSDLFYDAKQTQKMQQKRQLRDRAGNFVYDYKRGSFIEHRKRQLRKERFLYNVDDYGRYRGGVPTKQGLVRGKSLQEIGQTHDYQFHNNMRFHHHDSSRVTKGDAQLHREAMSLDEYNLRKERPWYPLLYDREQRHWRDRHYHLQMMFLITFVVYMYFKLPIEKYRFHAYNKNVNFVNGKLSPDHFVNRGGVVLQKEFLGFESTHANNKKLNDWYDMAYQNELPKKKQQ